MKDYYITTPIYYVNDKGHIGHAYCTMAVDIMACWKRLCGQKSFFLTGTDEHGLKISQAAHKKNIPEAEFVDGIVKSWKELWQKLDIKYDDFIRTSDARHVKTVQYLFQKLYDKGEIYKGKYTGLYCIPCETYFTQTQSPDKICPDCGRPINEVEEESYFFKLSKYTDFLLEYYEKHPEFLQPKEHALEIINFVKEGLKDLSVSRKKVKWGIQVPFDSEHTIYVWFDALINYLTGAGYLSNEKLFDSIWPCDMHVVGKEIFKFHSVIWPAMLKACGLELPKGVFAHGWWTHDGQKMSKSKGNTVDPVEFVDKYGIDPLRYFAFREIPFGSDGDFSEAAFLRRYNHDLANDLGNLFSRVLNMLEKFQKDEIPAGDYRIKEIPIMELEPVIAEIYEKFESLQFQQALNSLWRIVESSNRYIENEAPWSLAKNNDPKLEKVIINLYLCVMLVSTAIYPVMPHTAETVYEALKLKPEWLGAGKKIFTDYTLTVPAGIKNIKKIPPLFPRK